MDSMIQKMTNDNTLIKLIEDIYQQKAGHDFTFLKDLNIAYTEMPSLLHIYDVYRRNKEATVEAFIQYLGLKELSEDCLAKITLNLLRILYFYDMSEKNIEQNDFIHLCAKLYIKFYKNKYIGKGLSLPELPSTNPNGIFLDLVTGNDFINYYPFLNPETHYYLVDNSTFACEVLNLKKAEYPKLNIDILQKSVMDLLPDDFPTKIDVVRAKNVFAYAGFDFQYNIKKIQELILPGGIFIFQEHACHNTINHEIYAAIAPLFDGWDMEKNDGDATNPMSLATITYTKPF